MEEKILTNIEEKKSEYVDLLRKIIRIPSLTGEEGEAQGFLAKYLKDLGLQVEAWEPDIEEIFKKFPESAQYPTHWQHDLILPYDRFPTYTELIQTGKIDILNYKDRPNVVGTLRGQGNGKSLLLNGHIDNVTVEPKSDWTVDPFGAEMIDGKIFGRGACDMKGGLVAALAAVQCLIETGVSLKGDVIFSSVVNEEHSGGGALSMVCKGITADAAIVTEPSENRVCIAHPGDVYWQLTLQGVPRSPGARWEGDDMVGVSAIEKLPLVIKSLLKLEAEYNKAPPSALYKDIKPFSCVMGEISGGTYATATAGRCVLKGCVYFSPGLGSVNDIMDGIREYVKKGTESDPWFQKHPVDTEFLRHKNTALIDGNEPIVRAVLDCVKTVGGKEPSITAATYGADMELFVNCGKIPTVIFGPGSIVPAHKPDEFISIDEYITSIKTLALSIYSWCK
jgi:acetylornithine deacetylase